MLYPMLDFFFQRFFYIISETFIRMRKKIVNWLSLLSTYDIEIRKKYLIIHLKKLGITIHKIYLPISENLRNKKVFIVSQESVCEITHPFGIKYFLDPKEMNAEYFLVKKENGSIKKIITKDQIETA